MNDAVAGADLVRLSALPGQARTRKHEEDLLLVELDVRRSRPATRFNLDARHAEVARARRFAEVVPRPAEMTFLEALAFDVVPVRNQRSSSPSQ